MLRELRPPHCKATLIISEKSWRLGEVPEYWKETNVSPVFKNGKKNNPGNLILESMKQIILKTILKEMKAKKVTGISQRVFTKGKSYLTELIAFYHEMTTQCVRASDLFLSNQARLLKLSPITSS